jgi:two-component sensor histidine kinase
MLAPKTALAMSAAIQELSTNAAKYGAFSAPSGKLSVSWNVDESGRVHLTWTERDGPLVEKPARRGFGTRMIASIFGDGAGWSANLDFDSAGLRCSMQFHPRDEDRKAAKLMAAG